MNIKINFNKIARFMLMCVMVLGGLLALGSIYTAYIVDQDTKILHYNNMIYSCMKTPGSILNYEAFTPVFGSGIKMSCTVVNQDVRRI